MSLLGTIVGRIRIVETLGTGGMGEVYAGFDEKLDRRVALKALREEFRLNEDTKGRFLREARTLSHLQHPNICLIYDYIETEETDFLVLELIEGQTLTHALRKGIPERQKLDIAQQLAAVLIAAHGEGIVHRDLKPGNVMLTPEGQVKALCTFHHKAFDRGAISLDDNRCILVSQHVRGSHRVDEWLLSFLGRPLRRPQTGEPVPAGSAGAPSAAAPVLGNESR